MRPTQVGLSPSSSQLSPSGRTTRPAVFKQTDVGPVALIATGKPARHSSRGAPLPTRSHVPATDRASAPIAAGSLVRTPTRLSRISKPNPSD